VPKVSGRVAEDRADVLLYDHIVERVRAGGNYYQVAAQAQREGGYPLRPFVTMRPPTLAVIQATLANRTAVSVLFWTLLAATIIAWGHRLRRSELPMPRVILGTLLVAGGAATLTLPELLVWHEAWAALLSPSRSPCAATGASPRRSASDSRPCWFAKLPSSIRW
jgi:hypothetical protein